MIEYKIEKTKEKTYTPLLAGILDRVEPWLQRNGIEYEVFGPDDVPDNVPQCYTFDGMTSFVGVGYVYANLNSDQLIQAAEKMLRTRRKDI